MNIKISSILYLILVVGGPLSVALFCQTLVPGKLQLFLPAFGFVFALFCSFKDKARFGFSPELAFLVLFYLWSMLNQNKAFDDAITTTMYRNWLIIFGFVMGISAVLGYAGNRHWVRFFWNAVLFVGLFYSVVTIACHLDPSLHDAIYQRFFSDLDAVAAATDLRAGFTSHYSTNGMYIAIGLIACVPMFAAKKYLLGFRYVVVAIILIALLLTTKRAHLVFGVVSASTALVLFGSREKLSTSFKIFLALLALIVALYLSSLYFPELLVVFERFKDMFDSNSTTDRQMFVDLCKEMWEGSPIFGAGMGSFSANLNMTALGAKYTMQGFSIMSAHNCFWQVLAEEGTVGFVLFVGFLSYFLIGSIRLLLKLNRIGESYSLPRAYLAGSIALQLFFILYCVTGNPLYDMQTYIPYLLSCGVYLTVRRDAIGLRGSLFSGGYGYEI